MIRLASEGLIAPKTLIKAFLWEGHVWSTSSATLVVFVLSHLLYYRGVQLLHAGYGPSILAMDEGWQV